MPKAGLARFTVKNVAYGGHSKAWEHRLLFNSTGVFDKLYKVRDTLTTWYAPDLRILFGAKRSNEGNYYLIDELAFSPSAGGRTSVYSHRYTPTTTKIDTTFQVEDCTYDMLSTIMHLRSIDWKKLKNKDEFPLLVAVGKEVVKMRFRYVGQSVVEPDEHLKYRTHHFYIDIYDPAFEQSKESAEIWVGDDDNHIPIRVRAKLKIGAFEAYFKEASHLQHPLSCRIVIP